MNLTHLTWKDIDTAINSIILKMYNDNWRPDYIVGIARGGLPLAVMLSHRLKIPMYGLGISLRDMVGLESNLWMSEDAYGYVSSHPLVEPTITNERKQILVVDDINDTGATFNWLKDDWQRSCMLDSTNVWDTVWGHNVRFSVIIDNLVSSFDGVSYCWKEINKAENNEWIVFPWEDTYK